MKRLVYIGSVLALVLAIGASGVAAQQLSAPERLKHGIDLFNNQKYQEAIEVLQEIDPSQLPQFDRNKPALYIQKAQQDMTSQTGATDEMKLGEAALMSRKYVTALDYFAKAKELDYLSAAQSTRLASLTTLATNGEKTLRAETLAALTQAKKAEAAGNTDAAVAGYTQVLAADVRLPAADRQYAERHLAALTGGPKPVATTVRIEPKPAPVVTATRPVAVAKADGGLRPVVTPAEPTPVVQPKPAEVDIVITPATEPTVAVEPTPTVDVAALQRQAQAARLAEALTQAEAAMQSNDLRAARMHYERALAMDPASPAAKAGLERVDALLGRGTRSMLGKESDRRGVEEQRVVANVREAMKRARAAAEVAEQPAQYDRALEQLGAAYRMIDQSRVLTPETAEDLREEVKALADSVEAAKTARLAEIRIERDDAIKTREIERRMADQIARKRQIESLWTSAQQLAGRHEYKEAVAILDDLLVIDPQHEKARRFREDYGYFATLGDEIGIRQDRKREMQLSLTEVEEAAIPWTPLYRYPDAKTWQDLTAKRRRFVAGGAAESAVVAATRKKLRTKGIVNGEDWSLSLQLTATSLGSVLDFIAEAARARPREINIIIDRQGIEGAGVALDDPIDLQAKDISIEQALNMVMGDMLGFKIQEDGSVLVSSRENLNKDLPVVSYFVGDLITQVPDFGQFVPRMTIADVLATGDEGGGGGGVSLFEDTTTAEDAESGTQRLRDLIERIVRSTEPWESMGGRATLDFYERSGLMLVTQTADGHQKLQDLLGSLRRERAIMISIEARFVTVSDAFLNDITLDFDVTFNSMSNKWGTPPASTTHLSPGGAFDTLPNDGAVAPAVPAAIGQPIVVGSTSSNGAGTSSLRPGLSIFSDLFGGGWGANNGGMVISGVLLDDVQLGFLIRAIQADRRSTLLFAPRLTLWNGQRSWISDGRHYAYVSDLEPVVAEAAVGWDPTISYLVSGSVLDVKATASADRRYVQLDLRPQVALPPDMTSTTTVQAAVPYGVAEAVITLPRVQVTHLMTSVSVPDGGTLLIGGIKMFEEHDVEAGVPVLSKVPVLKRLFSNRAQVRGNSNLVILVKPTIIIQAEKEEELGIDEYVE